jgi:precorrin-6A synthase
MRRIFIIGIGAGNPDHITVQAIKALAGIDVVFVIDKGPEKDDLAALRREICARYITRPYRMVDIPDPVRDRTGATYEAGVLAWHSERARIYETLIAEKLGEDESGAFLVWGDPALYDSTIRIIDGIRARGVVAFSHEVIPGITSVQALTAGHAITANAIGGPVHITTGRRLGERPIEAADSIVVMLDGECAFRALAGEALDIFWGAYLGTDKEILISGRLSDVADTITQARAEARAAHGWIMDVYLLRRSVPS